MPKVRISPSLGRQIRLASYDAVGEDMLRRGKRVESLAKRLLSTNPKRVDTGRLRSSITTVPIRKRGVPGARIGTNVKYARYVHDGTGIYGPRRAPIRPKSKRFLRFKPKNARSFVYVKSVKGMRPNPFLRDALVAAL